MLTWSLKLTSMLSKFKNKLRTNEAEMNKNLSTASFNLNFTGCYKKKSVLEKNQQNNNS